MVAPTVGPYFRETNPGVFSKVHRTGMKQARPYNLDLEYSLDHWEGWDTLHSSETGSIVGPIKNVSWGVQSMSEYPRHLQATYNAAYAKLQSEICDSAGWGENIAQAGKTRKMINDRLTQVARFSIALKHKRFREAAGILFMPTPKRVSQNKAVSSNFLEYEYGVKPLLKDIQDSMKILTSDPGERRVRATKTSYWQERDSVSGPGFYQLDTAIGRVRVGLQATVRVTNPNLFLANQLGLLDLALPWKLIPFSFIVDWFVNVEQVISSCGNGFGLALTKPLTKVLLRGGHNYSARTFYEANGQVYTNTAARAQSHVRFARTIGISGPSLVVKPFKGFSLERGAQAIALVLSVFGK
jgi:hypothetical protein